MRGGGGVDGGDDHGVEERRAGVLVGVEGAQHDVLHGVRDQTYAEGHQHVADGAGGVDAGRAVDQRAHRDAQGEEPEGDGHDGDGRVAQALGDVVADRAVVAVRRGAGEPGQQSGHHRDGDDRLRHRPDQLRVVVGGDTGTGVARPSRPLPAAVESWVTTITPAWLASTKRIVHLASPAALPSPWPAPVETRPDAEAGGPQVRDHRQRLDDEPQQGADAQQPHALGRDAWRRSDADSAEPP